MVLTGAHKAPNAYGALADSYSAAVAAHQKAMHAPLLPAVLSLPNITLPIPLLAGGQNEAIAAHKEAMHAVFDLGQKWHRHEQPYRGSTDGITKWAMLEMWRMSVSR